MPFEVLTIKNPADYAVQNSHPSTSSPAYRHRLSHRERSREAESAHRPAPSEQHKRRSHRHKQHETRFHCVQSEIGPRTAKNRSKVRHVQRRQERDEDDEDAECRVSDKNRESTDNSRRRRDGREGRRSQHEDHRDADEKDVVVDVRDSEIHVPDVRHKHRRHRATLECVRYKDVRRECHMSKVKHVYTSSESTIKQRIRIKQTVVVPNSSVQHSSHGSQPHAHCRSSHKPHHVNNIVNCRHGHALPITYATPIEYFSAGAKGMLAKIKKRLKIGVDNKDDQNAATPETPREKSPKRNETAPCQMGESTSIEEPKVISLCLPARTNLEQLQQDERNNLNVTASTQTDVSKSFESIAEALADPHPFGERVVDSIQSVEGKVLGRKGGRHQYGKREGDHSDPMPRNWGDKNLIILQSCRVEQNATITNSDGGIGSALASCSEWTNGEDFSDITLKDFVEYIKYKREKTAKSSCKNISTDYFECTESETSHQDRTVQRPPRCPSKSRLYQFPDSSEVCGSQQGIATSIRDALAEDERDILDVTDDSSSRCANDVSKVPEELPSKTIKSSSNFVDLTPHLLKITSNSTKHVMDGKDIELSDLSKRIQRSDTKTQPDECINWVLTITSNSKKHVMDGKVDELPDLSKLLQRSDTKRQPNEYNITKGESGAESKNSIADGRETLSSESTSHSRSDKQPPSSSSNLARQEDTSTPSTLQSQRSYKKTITRRSTHAERVSSKTCADRSMNVKEDTSTESVRQALRSYKNKPKSSNHDKSDISKDGSLHGTEMNSSISTIQARSKNKTKGGQKDARSDLKNASTGSVPHGNEDQSTESFKQARRSCVNTASKSSNQYKSNAKEARAIKSRHTKDDHSYESITKARHSKKNIPREGNRKMYHSITDSTDNFHNRNDEHSPESLRDLNRSRLMTPVKDKFQAREDLNKNTPNDNMSATRHELSSEAIAPEHKARPSPSAGRRNDNCTTKLPVDESLSSESMRLRHRPSRGMKKPKTKRSRALLEFEYLRYTSDSDEVYSSSESLRLRRSFKKIPHKRSICAMVDFSAESVDDMPKYVQVLPAPVKATPVETSQRQQEKKRMQSPSPAVAPKPRKGNRLPVPAPRKFKKLSAPATRSSSGRSVSPSLRRPGSKESGPWTNQRAGSKDSKTPKGNLKHLGKKPAEGADTRRHADFSRNIASLNKRNAIIRERSKARRAKLAAKHFPPDDAPCRSLPKIGTHSGIMDVVASPESEKLNPTKTIHETHCDSKTLLVKRENVDINQIELPRTLNTKNCSPITADLEALFTGPSMSLAECYKRRKTPPRKLNDQGDLLTTDDFNRSEKCHTLSVSVEEHHKRPNKEESCNDSPPTLLEPNQVSTLSNLNQLDRDLKLTKSGENHESQNETSITTEETPVLDNHNTLLTKPGLEQLERALQRTMFTEGNKRPNRTLNWNKPTIKLDTRNELLTTQEINSQEIVPESSSSAQSQNRPTKKVSWDDSIKILDKQQQLTNLLDVNTPEVIPERSEFAQDHQRLNKEGDRNKSSETLDKQKEMMTMSEMDGLESFSERLLTRKGHIRDEKLVAMTSKFSLKSLGRIDFSEEGLGNLPKYVRIMPNSIKNVQDVQQATLTSDEFLAEGEEKLSLCVEKPTALTDLLESTALLLERGEALKESLMNCTDLKHLEITPVSSPRDRKKSDEGQHFNASVSAACNKETDNLTQHSKTEIGGNKFEKAITDENKYVSVPISTSKSNDVDALTKKLDDARKTQGKTPMNNGRPIPKPRDVSRRLGLIGNNFKAQNTEASSGVLDSNKSLQKKDLTQLEGVVQNECAPVNTALQCYSPKLNVPNTKRNTRPPSLQNRVYKIKHIDSKEDIPTAAKSKTPPVTKSTTAAPPVAARETVKCIDIAYDKCNEESDTDSDDGALKRCKTIAGWDITQTLSITTDTDEYDMVVTSGDECSRVAIRRSRRYTASRASTPSSARGNRSSPVRPAEPEREESPTRSVVAATSSASNTSHSTRDSTSDVSCPASLVSKRSYCNFQFKEGITTTLERVDEISENGSESSLEQRTYSQESLGSSQESELPEDDGAVDDTVLPPRDDLISNINEKIRKNNEDVTSQNWKHDKNDAHAAAAPAGSFTPSNGQNSSIKPENNGHVAPEPRSTSGDRRCSPADVTVQDHLGPAGHEQDVTDTHPGVQERGFKLRPEVRSALANMTSADILFSMNLEQCTNQGALPRYTRHNKEISSAKLLDVPIVNRQNDSIRLPSSNVDALVGAHHANDGHTSARENNVDLYEVKVCNNLIFKEPVQQGIHTMNPGYNAFENKDFIKKPQEMNQVLHSNDTYQNKNLSNEGVSPIAEHLPETCDLHGGRQHNEDMFKPKVQIVQHFTAVKQTQGVAENRKFLNKFSAPTRRQPVKPLCLVTVPKVNMVAPLSQIPPIYSSLTGCHTSQNLSEVKNTDENVVTLFKGTVQQSVPPSQVPVQNLDFLRNVQENLVRVPRVNDNHLSPSITQPIQDLEAAKEIPIVSDKCDSTPKTQPIQDPEVGRADQEDLLRIPRVRNKYSSPTSNQHTQDTSISLIRETPVASVRFPRVNKEMALAPKNIPAKHLSVKEDPIRVPPVTNNYAFPTKTQPTEDHACLLEYKEGVFQIHKVSGQPTSTLSEKPMPDLVKSKLITPDPVPSPRPGDLQSIFTQRHRRPTDILSTEKQSPPRQLASVEHQEAIARPRQVGGQAFTLEQQRSRSRDKSAEKHLSSALDPRARKDKRPGVMPETENSATEGNPKDSCQKQRNPAKTSQPNLGQPPCRRQEIDNKMSHSETQKQIWAASRNQERPPTPQSAARPADNAKKKKWYQKIMPGRKASNNRQATPSRRDNSGEVSDCASAGTIDKFLNSYSTIHDLYQNTTSCGSQDEMAESELGLLNPLEKIPTVPYQRHAK